MRSFLFAVLVLGAVGCEKQASQSGTPSSAGGAVATPPGVSPTGSKLLAPGNATDLRVSNDFKYASYIQNGKKPRLEGVIETLLVGELHLLPLDGGDPVRVAEGVSNNPGGHLFSADSKYLLALGAYSPATQSGTLEVIPVGKPSEKTRLGDQVTFLTMSEDGKAVAFLDKGVLKVGALGSGTYKEIAPEVVSARFSKDGKRVVFHGKASAGSQLLVAEVGSDAAPKKVAANVADYQVSPDSRTVAYTLRPSSASYGDLFVAIAPELKPKKVATASSAFGFSPDGKWLARTEGAKPDRNGDLFVGPGEGGAGTKVGQRVFEFKFAPDSAAVAFRENYDAKTSTGVMAVAELPSMKARRLGDRSPNYEWAPEGKLLAFQKRILQPIPIVQLMVHEVGEEKPTRIADDVFGYLFGPKNEFLLYRDKCMRGTNACTLSSVDLGKPTEAPRKIYEEAYSFKTSQDGSRALVTFKRFDTRDLYDLNLIELKTGTRKKLEEKVAIPAYFAAADGSKAVYIVGDRARAGVYAADATQQETARQ